MPANKPDDFWARLNRTDPSACWEWPGKRSKEGYGTFTINREYHRTHRYAWMGVNGAIPDGLWVLHRCDNPPCCNPAHLFLGTHTDNMADMKRKGRGRSGAPKGEAHHSHKLTEGDVRAIRAIKNKKQREIGRLYGISQATVSSILRKEYWPHVV